MGVYGSRFENAASIVINRSKGTAKATIDGALVGYESSHFRVKPEGKKMIVSFDKMWGTQIIVADSVTYEY